MRPLDYAINEIINKETTYKLYDYKIDGFSIYSLIRLDVRKSVIRQMGVPSMQVRGKIRSRKVLFSCVKSFFDVLGMLFSHHQFSNLFMAFPRVDMIDGQYLDKFTDPLIVCSNLGKDFKIFQPGRAGKHEFPRFNNQFIVNIDFLTAMSFLLSRIMIEFLPNKSREKFNLLFDSIKRAFPAVDFNYKSLLWTIYITRCNIYIYEKIIKKKAVKNIFATVRPVDVFIAGNRLGINTYELQHGISYGCSELYSGYRDELILPKKFLAFGENKPLDTYGIPEDRIVNIGFALNTYLHNLPRVEKPRNNCILVVSDPEITSALVPIIANLARDNSDFVFFFRCHPHEMLSAEQMTLLEYSGVKIQDNKINISVALNQFPIVIGENSTVMYEAISCGKKVGKLFFEGLHPKYLTPSDCVYFWEISNQEDFKTFLSASLTEKESKSIYSTFNQKLFNNLLK